MTVSVQFEDRRSIVVPIPADDETTCQLAAFAQKAAADGYLLKAASTVQSGHQRDPYTAGIKLVFERPQA